MTDIRAIRRTIKINYAKELILQGYDLNEICSKVDYKAPKHLGKAFKIETGITIVEYRKMNNLKKKSNSKFRGFGKETNGRLELLIETINNNPYIGTQELAKTLGYEHITSAYKLYNRRTGQNLGKFIKEIKNSIS